MFCPSPHPNTKVVLREWSPSLRLDYEFRLFVYKNTLTAISQVFLSPFIFLFLFFFLISLLPSPSPFLFFFLQYDHYGCYSHLIAQKNVLSKVLTTFWKEKIHPSVGLCTYIVDVGVVPSEGEEGGKGKGKEGRGELSERGEGVEEGEMEAVLIELSPFLRCTGPALFSWSGDDELLHGRGKGKAEEEEEVVQEEGQREGEGKVSEFFEFRIRTESRPSLDHLIEANWEDRWENAEGIAPYRPGERKEKNQENKKEEEDLFDQIISRFTSFFQPSPSTPSPTPSSPPPLPLLPSSSPSGPLPEGWVYMFVYGTLKRGFHWHKKFMSYESVFVGGGRMVKARHLVVGDSGVPYLEVGRGEKVGEEGGERKKCSVKGEIWKVGPEALENLDAYEGVGKKYYVRVPLEVELLGGEGEEGRVLECQVYGLEEFGEGLRGLCGLEEYTEEVHRERYRAVQHIQVKQLKYLGLEPNAAH